jgi:hypothetical protein
MSATAFIAIVVGAAGILAAGTWVAVEWLVSWRYGAPRKTRVFCNVEGTLRVVVDNCSEGARRRYLEHGWVEYP